MSRQALWEKRLFHAAQNRCELSNGHLYLFYSGQYPRSYIRRHAPPGTETGEDLQREIGEACTVPPNWIVIGKFAQLQGAEGFGEWHARVRIERPLEITALEKKWNELFGVSLAEK